MEIRMEKLTPARIGHFLHFFDHDAFSDHDEWAGCYCLESHISQQDNQQTWGDREKRRKMAEDFVMQGVMTGYLIYDGSRVIGWCNAGDKLNYEPVCRYEPLVTDCHEKGQIKLIYCFDIAKPYRGRGIARMLIEHILAEAAQEGYRFVEALPSNDRDFPYQYHGPMKLYEKFGFESIRELDWCHIVRKTL